MLHCLVDLCLVYGRGLVVLYDRGHAVRQPLDARSPLHLGHQFAECTEASDIMPRAWQERSLIYRELQIDSVDEVDKEAFVSPSYTASLNAADGELKKEGIGDENSHIR